MARKVTVQDTCDLCAEEFGKDTVVNSLTRITVQLVSADENGVENVVSLEVSKLCALCPSHRAGVLKPLAGVPEQTSQMPDPLSMPPGADEISGGGRQGKAGGPSGQDAPSTAAADDASTSISLARFKCEFCEAIVKGRSRPMHAKLIHEASVYEIAWQPLDIPADKIYWCKEGICGCTENGYPIANTGTGKAAHQRGVHSPAAKPTDAAT